MNIEDIKGIKVHEDGSLSSLSPFIRWKAGEDDIMLDDYFKIEELRAILAHIDKTVGRRTR